MQACCCLEESAADHHHRVARARTHANFRRPGLSPNHAHPHAADVPVVRRAVAPLHAEEVS
jgi:hypothetical protein